MSVTVEYKCPSCGGGVQFDSASQQMKCPYCGTSFKMEDAKALQDVMAEDRDDHCEWESYAAQSGSGDWKEGEQEAMRRYSCQSCGGEIVTDGSTAATSCPYCGNPVVLLGQLGYVAAVSGIVMAICTMKGYELLGGRFSTVGLVVSIVLMLGMTYVGYQLDWSVAVYNELK